MPPDCRRAFNIGKGAFDIEIIGGQRKATIIVDPPFDPKGERMRSHFHVSHCNRRCSHLLDVINESCPLDRSTVKPDLLFGGELHAGPVEV
jgi:hypothetical protein